MWFLSDTRPPVIGALDEMNRFEPPSANYLIPIAKSEVKYKASAVRFCYCRDAREDSVFIFVIHVPFPFFIFHCPLSCLVLFTTMGVCWICLGFELSRNTEVGQWTM